MLTAVFSLTGALVFGAADFLGGLAAKRVSSILATAVAALSGLIVLLAAYPVLGGAWSPHDMWWGVLSGLIGAVAISLLYACLAIGPMSILSPLTAVVSAVVPMLWGLLVAGERLAVLGYWALGVALVAVVLVGFVPEKGAVRPSPRGVLMAVGSGVAIGGFFITIDQTSDESGVVPLILNRGVTATIMFTVLGVLALAAVARARARSRQRTGEPTVAMAHGERMPHPAPAPDTLAMPPAPDPDPRRISDTAAGVRLAIACGVVDVVANTLLLLGIRAGDLSVAAVLGAMYPAGTILLAALVLKERIAPVQYVGLVLALAAAGMLAVA
ncbi:EamA family transporter [Agromyces ramosus]|uniref:Drug/metabolite transporter (DMT)-like permease n=1 Tax=Agromyces ramosus TaxID=33879 RepID=A0ABU0R5L1_9MICO|nr:EamA family transporter [Agromyces ramosus]MDQ0893374.1 drug/metabolite transporter (DMT)-like permease [Agromyces ramosus]